MSILYYVVLVVGISPFAYYLLCFACVIGYFRRLHPAPVEKDSVLPPVSIIKPVRGLDREAYENFSSFCRLDYPVYELLFAVSDEDDQVIPVIERLQMDFQNAVSD